MYYASLIQMGLYFVIIFSGQVITYYPTNNVAMDFLTLIIFLPEMFEVLKVSSYILQ